MCKTLILTSLLVLFAIPAYAQRIQLGCAMTAPAAWVDGKDMAKMVECLPDKQAEGIMYSSFPYKIPANKSLCVTDYVLVNKFPYDPPEYGTRMRTLYALFPAMTVSAHAPYLNLRTPQRYVAASTPTFQAWVINGMSEPQNVIVYVFGFLGPAGDCPR